MAHHHQHHHGVDAEHHPMGGQPGEGARDGRHGKHRARAVQPSGRHRVGHRPVDGPHTLVRSENMRGKSQRQHQGERHRDRDDENDCGGAVVVGAEYGAQNQHQPGAEERRRTAGGRRDRVHRHHLLAGHHVRQCRRKARGDEPGEPVDDQRTEQDGPVAGSRREQRGDAEHQDQPREVGSDQHRPPVPSVQQSARERTENRVGEIQNGERGRDLPRACGAFGAED